MTQVTGWIVSSDNPFLTRPLLGKSCQEHAKSALEAAGIPLSAEVPPPAQAAPFLLFVREDAPFVSAESLTALLSAVDSGTPCALWSQETGSLLACALPSFQWAALCQTEAPVKALTALFRAPSRPAHWTALPSGEALEPVTTAQTYVAALSHLRAAIAKRHMDNGAILLDPDRTTIEADVEIGANTLVYPGNLLQGATRIGANCTLYPNNRLQNAVVGEDTTVENSVLLDCSVGSHTTVGPFAYLRPKSSIGDHCRIGDFVEVKNSSIGDSTKVSHLTYVGDSDLGKDINLGCGVVFVNYDGKAKNRCTVEDHAFIGCNCNLVAPVRIGKNAYLAAGSTVVEDVPEDALYVARSRGVLKEDWVKRRKEQGKL